MMSIIGFSIGILGFLLKPKKTLADEENVVQANSETVQAEIEISTVDCDWPLSGINVESKLFIFSLITTAHNTKIPFCSHDKFMGGEDQPFLYPLIYERPYSIASRNLHKLRRN